MNELLTFHEIYLILEEAKYAFKKDFERWNLEQDLMLYNLCNDIEHKAICSPADFFSIKDDNPF